MTPSACLLCGSKKRQTVFQYTEPDSYERSVGVRDSQYYRAWVSCDDCGFYYSCYSRNPDILDRIYETIYRTANNDWRQCSTEDIFNKVISLPSQESETQARVNWIKSQMAELSAAGIISSAMHSQQFLDVGGATGVFGYLFQDAGWRGAIIDPSRDGAFIEKYGMTYYQAAYADKSFDKKFNLISLIFVLEHVRTPDEILCKARRDLNPGGVIYIEVPDDIAFTRKPASDDIFNSCHLWMFSPKTLVMLLRRCGFEIVSLKRTRTLRGHYSLMLLATPCP